MKIALGVAIIAVLLGSLGWYEYSRRPVAASTSCIAGDGELCASDDWLHSYHEAVDLQKKINNDPDNIRLQRLRDQVSGMGQRLAQTQPQGYEWNDTKQKFVRKPPTPITAKQ